VVGGSVLVRCLFRLLRRPVLFNILPLVGVGVPCSFLVRGRVIVLGRPTVQVKLLAEP